MQIIAIENSNSELFREMWKIAINGKADWGQIITWNDYSEASDIKSEGIEYQDLLYRSNGIVGT